MKAEVICKETQEEFLAYCRTYRLEGDDSYLYEEDLANFDPDHDNPTVVIRDQGEIIAAASLILDDYHRRGHRGRFRIFHAVDRKFETYRTLFEALIPAAESLGHVIVFVPDQEAEAGQVMADLGFLVERSSCFLVRDLKMLLPVPALPQGFTMQTFQPGKDERKWIHVRNEAFAQLLGSQTPLVEDQVAKMIQEEGHLPQGMMIVFHGDRAVGLVRGAGDEYEDQPVMNIGPLAILPAYQGRGLGRTLLRASLAYGKDQGYARAVLSVNAENKGARALYLKEGFIQVEGLRCFRYTMK